MGFDGYAFTRTWVGDRWGGPSYQSSCFKPASMALLAAAHAEGRREGLEEAFDAAARKAAFPFNHQGIARAIRNLAAEGETSKEGSDV